MQESTIGWAVEQMKNGKRVFRTGWDETGQFLKIQNTKTDSDMTLWYVYITTVQGDRVPWPCSQADLLATDWELAK